jgi:ubiquinone/menaquinone biosynthesis C-methylase UbiE
MREINMIEKSPATGWNSVDETTDPTYFVQYLDDVKAVESSLAYKQKTFALLAVQRGHHILDVGCGTGEDVLELARLTGRSGRVVGVDNSETMVVKARKRAEEVDLPVEYYHGDVHRLDFAEDTFDGCRADRTFQYLQTPKKALSEIVRVVQSKGHIVISEPDWETLVVDAPDRYVTRTILNHGCDSTPNGWIGRELPAFFKKAGLTNIVVVPITFTLTDYTMANEVFRLEKTAESAHHAGLISASEAASWLHSLQRADQAHQFFSAIMGFITKGQKP